MKRSLLLLLCWPVALVAHAQTSPGMAAVASIAKSVLLPLIGLYILCWFVLTTIRLILAHLLKRELIATSTSESVIAQLLPGPQDERNRVVKWIALLTSTGGGLALSNWYAPWGIESVVILLFSTALGFAAYYFYLLRQPK